MGGSVIDDGARLQLIHPLVSIRRAFLAKFSRPVFGTVARLDHSGYRIEAEGEIAKQVEHAGRALKAT